MCGILGTIPTTDNNKFKYALDTLTHRGPDGYGIVHLDNISLGHRRLSIVDLSQNSKQPMSYYYDNRYTITFNGEIYNFLELKNELKKEGYKFISDGDTEVILASYIKWKEKCLNKFNGMWAFAIWDNYKKELFLSRDRFGKKPLFYAFIDNKFIFASEMKAIYPFLHNLEISDDFDFMSKNIFTYESTSKCLIKNIQRFPASYYAIYKNQNLKFKRYWNQLDNLIKVPNNYQEQVEYFRELFIDSVKLRMRSDVPISTALSGGVDSSATISTMNYISKKYPNKRFYNDIQNAFVASMPNSDFDETEEAQKVIEHLNINGTFIKIDPLKDWDKIYYYFYMFEELYLTSPIPMLQTYQTISKNNIKVTLDGHGADELFSGYSVSLFQTFANIKNIQEINNIFDTLEGIDNVSYTNIQRIKIYLTYMIKYYLKKLLNKEQKSKDSKHLNYSKLDNFNKHLYMLSFDTILPTLLRNYDRYSMINSLEIRMPFLDHRITSFAFSINWDSKIRNGYTKSIIRDALKDIVTNDILYKKRKIGFNSPIKKWIKNELKEYFLDIIASKDFKECPVINVNNVTNNILKAINHDISNYEAELIWTSFMPFIWYEANIKKRYIL